MRPRNKLLACWKHCCSTKICTEILVASNRTSSRFAADCATRTYMPHTYTAIDMHTHTYIHSNRYAHTYLHSNGLASSPGSRKGVGRKESLVHTVCACARNSPILGNLYSVSILPCQPLRRTHRILQQQSSFCNLFLRRSILT